jgi:hypothetical protein
VNALAGTNDGALDNTESRSPVHPNSNDEAPQIEMLSAVQFETLLANAGELSEAFAIRLWQGPGLLGGTEHGQVMSLSFSGILPALPLNGAGVALVAG